MTHHETECQEVRTVARGDARDAAAVRAHLQMCAPCASEVADVRILVGMTRRALDAEAEATLARRPLRPLDALRLSAASADPLRGLAFAASAAIAVVSLTALLAAHELAGARIATPVADAGQRYILELGSPEQERLPFVLRTPVGVRRGDLDFASQDVLDTIPANMVVVDTF